MSTATLFSSRGRTNPSFSVIVQQLRVQQFAPHMPSFMLTFKSCHAETAEIKSFLKVCRLANQ